MEQPNRVASIMPQRQKAARRQLLMATRDFVGNNYAVADRADFGMVIKCRNDAGELVRVPPVIGIEESDDVAATKPQALVEARCLSAIRLAMDADTASVAPEDLRRLVA